MTTLQAEEGDNGIPPLSILEKLGMLTDLQSEFAKAIKEQETIKQRHRQELGDVAARRKKYADDILAAMEDLNNADSAEDTARVSSLPLPSPAAHEPLKSEPKSIQLQEPTSHLQGHVEDKEEDDQKLTKQGREPELPAEATTMPKFEKRGVLKMSILQVFAEQDSFLTADDVVSIIDERYPNNDISRAQITDCLKDARRSAIVGHRTYQGRLPIYLNGLPSFYANVERKEIKPEYEDKYIDRMIELGLSNTIGAPTPKSVVADTKGSATSLFQQVTSEGAEQKTAPVETGAE